MRRVLVSVSLPLASLAFVLAPGCAPSAPEEPTGESAEAITVCATATNVRGIDVSVYQGNINWPAAAAGGVKFAQIRLANVLADDTKFAQNWQGAKAAGIYRGAYQYFNPNVDAAAQANKMIDGLKKAGFGPGDLPPEIDVEWNANDIPSPAAYATAIRTWITMVKAAFGVTPMIYAGGPYWTANVKSTEWANNPLWHPEYPNYPNTIYPMNVTPAPLAGCPKYLSAAMPKWTFWQFAGENGRAPGVSGPVDINVFNGTLEDLKKLARVPGTTLDAGADGGYDGSDDGAMGNDASMSSSSSTSSGSPPPETPPSANTDSGSEEGSSGGCSATPRDPGHSGIVLLAIALAVVASARRRAADLS